MESGTTYYIAIGGYDTNLGEFYLEWGFSSEADLPQRLKWQTAFSSAIAEAKRSGKLILLLSGRETCINTRLTRNDTCEDPDVRVALDGYVLWFCNCDTQGKDIAKYVSDKTVFSLPLVCVINPYVPNTYVGRSFGPMGVDDMLSFLRANGPKAVTFDANGGEVNEQERMVLPRSAIGKLPTPRRGKYTFIGWYTKKSGGTKISLSTVIKTNMTYYAHWASPWIVTFNANGGTLGEDLTNKVQIARSKAVGSYPTPTRAGYAFKGWFTKKSGGTKITTKTKVTKNVTWYAQWTAKKYKVAVTKVGKGTVSGAGSKAYQSKVTLKAKAASGYVFQGWYKTVADEEDALVSQKATYSFKVPLDGVTLKAKFITKTEDKAGIGMAFGSVGVGAMAEEDGGQWLPALPVRKVTVSVTSAGKISAKVGSLSLAKTGWTVGEDGLYRATLSATRTVGTGKKAKKYKDVMTLVLDPEAAWTEDQLTGTFTTCLATTPDAPTNLDSALSARRNPFGDNAEAKAAAKQLAALGTRDFIDDDEIAWKLKVSASGVATISRTTGTGKKKKTVSATAVVAIEPLDLLDPAAGYRAAARFLVGGKVVGASW